jgi:predicted 2-oxoglutarate/Fe(II)-dependent dioxygenase YbiX
MTIQIQQPLLEMLAKIDRPGTFCTSGILPSTLPGLEIVGVGSVALPLEKRQATTIKKQAHQAPYGKGTQTLVDTNVRRVWEIDAEQVVLANPEWQDVLKQAVNFVKSELGLENQDLRANFYKLLLYESGSFFLAHRDGEKLDRMVATLVVVLPSDHEGGELVVRHEDREEIIDFGPKSRFQTQFAAFYADCEHEIRPVTKGFRLTLVYNLTLEKSKQSITAPTSREHIASAIRLLRRWSSQKHATPGSNTDLPPAKLGSTRRTDGFRETPSSNTKSPSSKLAVLLDHRYTQAGLTFDALKGTDRVKADILFAAAREAGCDASLALVTYQESGSAEPSGSYGYGYSRKRRYGRYDDEADDEVVGEHVMGEIFDQSLTAEHFSDAEGNSLAFGRLFLEEEEVVSNQPLNEGKPDREDFEDYTGNAGMTLQRWYHRAAILLWPAESRFDVLHRAGVRATIGALEQMIRQWKQTKKSEQEILKQSCLEFARRIIAHWPEQKFASSYFAGYEADYRLEEYDDEDWPEEDYEEDYDEDENPDDLDEVDSSPEGHDASKVSPPSLLALLELLDDVSLIADWIRGVLAKDVNVDPGKILGDLCNKYGWTTFQDGLRELFENTSNETLERHARLLADWSLRRDKTPDHRKLSSQLAQQMMLAIERWEPKQENRDWHARKVNLSELLPPLIQAFHVLEEPELFDRLVTYVLTRPKEFDLTTIQVPVLLSLETWFKRNVKHPSPALNRWLTAIIKELEFRKSHPPKEPGDWQRESATGCDCVDCKALSQFLKDPNTKTLRLPLAEHRRRHLMQVIDGRKLDATHVTEQRGRPFTLVCTKTKASYEQALKAHRVDLDHLAKVRKLLECHEGLSTNPAPIKGNNRKTTKKRKAP